MAAALLASVVESLDSLMNEDFGLLRKTPRLKIKIQGAVDQLRILVNDEVAALRLRQSNRKLGASIVEIACNLEDIVESYLLRNGSRFATSFGFVRVRKTEQQIRIINDQLSHLISAVISSSDMSSLSQQAPMDNNVRPTTRSTVTTPILGLDAVGLDPAISSLLRHLVGGENSPGIVCVTGMGGIGKTTLAKRVYNHPDVRARFECTAWVCLSEQFHYRDVLQDILTQLTGATDEQRREFALLNASDIVQLLIHTQQRNNCFIVLDDMWTSDAWDSLKLAVLGEGAKSKILTTTRSDEVASHVTAGGDFLFKAQPLSSDQGWELLKRIAIPDDDPTESIEQKEVLGGEVVKICAGIPLAIKVVGGVLRGKTVKEWSNWCKDLEILPIESSYESTLRVLTMSYDMLPASLQICFQYLANFPQSYEIPEKTLTQLWIADGLITSELAENMENTSYDYLNELVERSMVQVEKRSLTGNIKIVSLHDLVQDMCHRVAARDNYVHVFNSSNNKEIQASVKKVRRLAVHLDGIGHELAPSSDKSFASLRSLLFFVTGHYYSDMYRKLLRSLCRDFKFLRVLKFEDMKAEPEVELPSDIGNLVHLRFLSLKNTEIKRIPSTMANLIFMQTLDLRSVEWVSVKIPNVFWKMVKLRHLYLPLNHRVAEKLLLATLLELQTLANIASHDFDLKDLSKLTKLRKLVLDARGPADFKPLEEFMTSSLIKFDHLQSLSLVTGDDNGDIPAFMVSRSVNVLMKLQLYGTIIQFPDKDHLSKLIKLTLEETNLDACHIQILEKLPQLKKLSLRMGALKSDTMVFSKEAFPQLDFLSLIGLCELKNWTVEEGAMPNLCSLHIGYCWRLRAVPDGLQHITTLKKLTIERMYDEFCKTLEKGGAYFDKLSHASVSVTITNKRS